MSNLDDSQDILCRIGFLIKPKKELIDRLKEVEPENVDYFEENFVVFTEYLPF